MPIKIPSKGQIIFCFFLAFVFWTLIFGLQIVNFWVGISVAACVLVFLSIRFAGIPIYRTDFTTENVLLGSSSAALLYGVFALFYWLSAQIWPLATTELAGIYQLRDTAHPLLISLILVFVTSPAEELFWRGFLQKWSMEWFGKKQGWLLTTFCYTLIHIASMNNALIVAALVGGLFWGSLYMLTRSVFACIVSHAIWSVAIFILWPII